MNGNARKYKISLRTREYTLVSDESEDHISKVTQVVNQVLDEITRAAVNESEHDLTLLTALSLASKLVHAQSALVSHDARDKQLLELIDQAVPA